MLKLMKDLPDNVIGVTGEGEITGSDYENILIPAVEEKLKNHEKVRFIYHMGKDFKGFDAKAMFDDTMLGIKHFTAWERIAFVSDHDHYNSMVKFFGHLIPGDIKVFKNDELNDAIKWVSED
ncbi:MAG: STAS/SEC14 domain-containing protein [Ignavibacteriae bacterium]|nr:STAS/SEC14 domain-containing protein [Ignavibacteriota bacterium]